MKGKTLLIRLDEWLHRDFKLVCAAMNVDMSSVLQDYIYTYVAEHADKVELADHETTKDTVATE